MFFDVGGKPDNGNPKAGAKAQDQTLDSFFFGNCFVTSRGLWLQGPKDITSTDQK